MFTGARIFHPMVIVTQLINIQRRIMRGLKRELIPSQDISSPHMITLPMIRILWS